MNRETLKRIVLVAMFAVPFVPFLVSGSLFFPFITTKAFAFRFLVELAFAAWLILAASFPEYRPKDSRLTYAVFIFLVVVGVADFSGVAPLKSFWSNFERMEGYVLILHLGAFFLVMTSVFKEADWKRWWNTTLFASFLMVIYSVLQIIGVKSISQGGVRVDGTFGNAIYLAVYLLFHIFIAMLLLSREWKKKNLRWMYILLILSQVFILYFTATRGTILGLLGGLVILAILNIRNKVSLTFLIGLAVLLGGFFAIRNAEFVQQSPVLSRFANLSTKELETQGRYFIWPMAWRGVKEHPVLGWGQENFSYVFQKHYNPEMYNLEPWFDRAHNVFLDWAIAGGLLALISYLAFYAAALSIVWKRASFSYLEKSIFTSLLAAYFFHNIFVFDHLFSYVLFFAVLSYLNSRIEEGPLWKKNLNPSLVRNIVAPAAAAVFVFSFYFSVWRPLKASSSLLNGLINIQTGQFKPAIANFETAYAAGPMGRPEVVEQITGNAAPILRSPLPIEERNAFYSFAKNAALEQAAKLPDDARMQLISGLFLSSTGSFDEGLKILEHAKALSPDKQDIYFNLSSAYFSNNQGAKALESLRAAYELEPNYGRAKSLYLVGAIYVGNGAIERDLRSKFSERDLAFDDSVLSAYYQMKRYAEVRALLETRKRLDPQNAATYDNYLKQIPG